MAVITWNETLSVGVKTFDQEHKRLIDLINQLHDAMGQGKGQEELDGIISQLIDYTRIHFANEEKVMNKYAYPRATTQHAAHEVLSKKVVDFQKELKSGKVGLSLQVSSFLKSWLTDHILKEDKQYSAFFKEKGVS
jgi:hemerythrin